MYLAVDLPPGTGPNLLVEVLTGHAGAGALFWEIDS